MGFLTKFAISIVLAVVVTSGIGMLFTSMGSAYGVTFSIMDVSPQMIAITNKTADFQNQMQTAITTINPLSFIATTVLTPISLLFSFIDMFSEITSQVIAGLTGNGFNPGMYIGPGKTNFVSFLTLINSGVVAIIAIKIGKTVVDSVFKSDT